MGRGMVGGIIWGVVVCGLALFALSVLGTPPRQPGGEAPAPGFATRPEPAAPRAPSPEAAPSPAPVARPETPPAATPAAQPATDIELPPGSEFNRPPPETEASLPGAEPKPRETPKVQAPDAAETLAETPLIVTAPTAAPALETAGPEAMAPPPSADAPRGLAAEEPVLPSPGVLGPSTPDTAAPPAERATARPAPGDAPSQPGGPTWMEAPDQTPPASGAQTGADAAAGTGGEQAAQEAPEPTRRLTSPSEAVPGSAPRVGQMPKSADAPDPAPQTVPAMGTAAGDARPTIGGLGALALNAVPFRAEGTRPLVAVILIDAGEAGLDRDALLTFSFPVTFAVDPTRADAVEAMDAYRAAGYEVVALATGLPQGATVRDVEARLGRDLGRLDASVALMDLPEGGFEKDRALSAQAVALVEETGHGLLTYDRGLRMAERLASAAGVPQATIDRVLDDDRPDALTVRRRLDRAVFEARQAGRAVLVGHSYSETVTALFAWALELRDVTLAPVSAVLRLP